MPTKTLTPPSTVLLLCSYGITNQPWQKARPEINYGPEIKDRFEVLLPQTGQRFRVVVEEMPEEL